KDQTVYAVKMKPRAAIVADEYASDYFENTDAMPEEQAAQTKEEREERRRQAGTPLQLCHKELVSSGRRSNLRQHRQSQARRLPRSLRPSGDWGRSKRHRHSHGCRRAGPERYSL